MLYACCKPHTLPRRQLDWPRRKRIVNRIQHITVCALGYDYVFTDRNYGCVNRGSRQTCTLFITLCVWFLQVRKKSLLNTASFRHLDFMCGILFLAHADSDRCPLSQDLWQSLCQANSSRCQLSDHHRYTLLTRDKLGPDSQNKHRFSIHGHSAAAIKQSTINFCFVASELRLRGEGFIDQPHLREGNILSWNGEVSALD